MKDRLIEERKRLGLTQDKFAEIGKVTKRTYCDYEAGVSEPRVSFLAAIAAVGADVQYIVTGIRSSQPNDDDPPTNSADFNKKRMDKLMDELTTKQQGELLKIAEEKKRLNQCEVELNEFKKRAG